MDEQEYAEIEDESSVGELFNTILANAVDE